jgi:hypothetical protein
MCAYVMGSSELQDMATRRLCYGNDCTDPQMQVEE